MVAMPDDKLPPFATQSLAGNGAFIGGSHIGNKKEALQMLQVAADKGVCHTTPTSNSVLGSSRLLKVSIDPP